MAITLKDKFRGCIMGAHIGSAMGAQVEGWTWQKIEEKCGFVEDFTSYEHYNNGWVREPGTTEDGIEPVSYTHLDVYKRQQLHRPVFAHAD